MAQPEKIFVPRFATQRLKEGGRSERQPISHWRETPAYVLLGDPGAGKTKALTDEAQACGAQVASAADFGIVASQRGAKGVPVFIDGLDEKRAGNTDTDALNAIRIELGKLKNPKFRITCREIDWLGGVDTNALKAVSPNGEIAELHLEPLTDSDIESLLVNWRGELPDPLAFWTYATERGLQDWLRNPMALELFVKAVLRAKNGGLPESKLEIFKLACEQLASEFNEQHVASRRRAQPALDQILDDAGKMFATLLLSNADGLTSTAAAHDGTGSIIALNTLPSELAIKNEAAARASLLFTTVNGQSKPYHRTIAEYLGAVAIGKLVEDGLPIGRMLALMSGQDGGIVEPLRGLHAWMAVTCPRERTQLIDRDPLGAVMYGDVRAFSRDEKLHIFKALAGEAERYAWFRNGDWNAHPFGALGTRDMVGAMQEILSSGERSQAHQSLLDCVMDAIRFGDDLPAMLPYLEQVVRDATYMSDARLAAMHASLAQAKADFVPARQWLDDIRAGQIEDPDGRLRGALLKALYPVHLTPTEVVNYLYQTEQGDFVGRYGNFLSTHLLSQTPTGKFSELADAFASLNLYRATLAEDFDLHRPICEVIVAAIRESSNESSTRRLISWLQIGRDGKSGVAIKGDDIGRALGKNVETLKRVYAELCSRVEVNEQSGNLDFLSPAEFLYGSKLPSDWYNWLLTLAETAQSAELARFYLQDAATEALKGEFDFDIRMEDVEAWVTRNLPIWPEAENWLSASWSQPPDHWQAKQYQQGQKHRVERLNKEKLRHQNYAEHFEQSADDLIDIGVLSRLALAYKNRLFGIGGDTPAARLHNLVGGGESRFEIAFKHLKSSLTRPDLPTSDEILKSGLAGKEHFVRFPCLVAAEIAFAESPDVLKNWSDDLLKRLVAFWLTDGTGDEPAWYAALVCTQPQLVAAVMVPFTVHTIRKRSGFSVTGLWDLARKDDLKEFARAVVPVILEKFPVRSNEHQLKRLVEELLPAGLKHLEPKTLAAIAAKKLANTSMDAGQRVAWLAIGIFQNNMAIAKALVKFLGKSQSRVQHLIHALVGQTDRDMNHLTLSIETQSLLIELLGPRASPAWSDRGYTVRPVDKVRDITRIMITTLSGLTDPAASRELARLRSLPALGAWFESLDAAMYDNTRLLRAASFVHASPQRVASTLANQAPANAADLQALVIDQLLGLEKEIRGSDANLLYQFWVDDGAGSRKPELENPCRDRLLAPLRGRLLAKDVQVDKELHAFDDKRMDMRASTVSGGQRQIVPVEIKRENDINVWTAWRDQLDRKYLTEPDSGGYGIYLVLWFGHQPKAFEGVKPKSAKEMAAMLQDRIPAADRFRISVVVMDLSEEQTQIKAAKKKSAA
jgi:hypothetical protein